MKNQNLFTPSKGWTACMFALLCLCLTFSSCSSDGTDLDDLNIPVNDPTRMYFENAEAFLSYLEDHRTVTATNTNPDMQPSDIMRKFIRNTPEGAILNDRLEYQIGDTIYKYSQSGYCIFAIEIEKYQEGLRYAHRESDLIKHLSRYKEVYPYTYQLCEGVRLYYSGDPVYEEITYFAAPKTRMSLDGKTKVQASFWKTRNNYMSSCGVKVQAWSRDNVGVGFEDADTDLKLEFNVTINIPQLSETSSYSGTITDHGNERSETLFVRTDPTGRTGSVLINMIAPSTIKGSAKCWDNSWITHTVTK